MNTALNFRRRFQIALLLVALTPFAWLSWSATNAQEQQLPQQTPQASPTPASTPPDRQPGTPTGQIRFDAPSPTPSPSPQASPTPSDPMRALRYRSIGPFRGGRVTAVAGVTSQPYVYYFGATGGGVWKTTDGGVNWEPVSDGQFGTGSVGAIGVAESDPNVIYVGMGESPIRGNVSHGDGMYKSIDAGRTWRRIGLENTRHIARVRVHPRNPDLVYAAVLGHIFAPHEERGVYRSRDGGRTWQRILFRNNRAGAIDLILDPTNPNIIYAGFWEVFRTPWSLESGGQGSGLFKSIDGGDTWTELTRNPGMPTGVIGKVGITVSPVNPDRLWAMVEAEEGGVFRSDNAGATWTRTNADRNLRQRAWYYTRIYADTQNIDTVYVLNVGFHRSSDGGRTFAQVPTPHSDNHDLWIAPNDANRMVEGNDGGANVTFNGGRTWTEQDQATAQFYRVAIDNDFPYNIYGAQQDNSTVRIPSRTSDFGIDETHWYDVGGGESGWIAPHPGDSNIVFAGSYGGLLTRYNHRNRQLRNVTVWPDNPMGAGAEAMRYRFQWNFPILFSPHQNTDGTHNLYAGGNVLFRSTNEGQSWQAISPDLTRNDRTKQGPSGGPITRDNTSVEYYCTIFAVAESPVERGVIWAGSDDGLIHVTRNGGENWERAMPRDMPEWIQINSIEASPHAAGTAYVAATMYKWDDFRPYLYKTTDYGRTWRRINNGIPDGAFTRVVREDPNRRGVLYAGTETGMYVSFNDGENWQPLQLNLPVVPITDLAVHRRDDDLIVATQGRSFWILDDLSLLRALSNRGQYERADAFLFKPEDAYRTTGGGGSPLPASAPIGANPPNGVVVHYFLRNRPAGEIALEFLDSSGNVIRRFTGRSETATAPGGGGRGGQMAGGRTGEAGGEPAGPRLPVQIGLNRFVWDMRHEDASRFPGMILWAASTRGPRVVPGNYSVRLTAGGQTLTETFEVRRDPRIETSPQDYARQLELLLRIRDKVTETHDAIRNIRSIRTQLESVTERVRNQPNANAVTERANALRTRLTAIEEELYQTRLQSNQDPLNFPIRLNNKLAALGGVVDSADAAPTDQSYALYEELTRQIDAQLNLYRAIVANDIPAFNQFVREQSVPAVSVPTSGRGR
jgi:photosystem II stability/assembly factor-like uncharacterized protein